MENRAIDIIQVDEYTSEFHIRDNQSHSKTVIEIDRKLDFKIRRFNLTHRKVIGFAITRVHKHEDGEFEVDYIGGNIKFLYKKEAGTLLVKDIIPK